MVQPVKKTLVEWKDDQGRLAIHIASYKDVDAVTQTLLAHGANPQVVLPHLPWIQLYRVILHTSFGV